MAKILSVGTPANTHATAGSVTGAWGAGQNRAAGNLLVCCISAAATTSCTSISLPAGWTNLANNGNAATANARYRVCCLTAAGADAAPTSTTTLTGTGGMDIILLELAGTASAGAQDGPAGAEFLSGTTAVTLAAATFIATSAGGPALSLDEEFSLAWFVQERAAAILTFTDAGTGWTKVLNGNGQSSVLQSALLTKTPGAGTVQATGAFSTNTTAFGTLRIVTFLSSREPQRLTQRRLIPARRPLATASYR